MRSLRAPGMKDNGQFDLVRLLGMPATNLGAKSPCKSHGHALNPCCLSRVLGRWIRWVPPAKQVAWYG